MTEKSCENCEIAKLKNSVCVNCIYKPSYSIIQQKVKDDKELIEKQQREYAVLAKICEQQKEENARW